MENIGSQVKAKRPEPSRDHLVDRAEYGVGEIVQGLQVVARASGRSGSEIQQAVGWSPLATVRQRRMRLLDVLRFLDFVGVEPGWFFSRLFEFEWEGPKPSVEVPLGPATWRPPPGRDGRISNVDGAPLARYMALRNARR